MKKQLKEKDPFVPQEAEQDVAGLLIKLQQQLSFLEKKIDILIGQSQENTIKTEYHPKPFQRFDRPSHQRDTRPDNNFRDRVLHKAICADCSKECEVPFRPSQDRPVYCKDCFSKRKGGSSFKGHSENKPWSPGADRMSHAGRSHEGGKKKFFGKKRPAVKRRKVRS